MGWTIDLFRTDLDSIFKGLEKQYTIQHVEATQPTIRIMHEGDIPRNVMKGIVAMFPDFVYVNFVPNSTFPIGTTIMETH